MAKGEQTRQRIIAAAAPIFNQRGYTGCSMQDIMEATGLEKGGLYRHFANKEELAAEAFRFALAQCVKTRTEDLENIEGSVAKLRSVVQRFLATPSPMPGGCPLFNTAIDADDGNLVLRELVRDGIQAWKARISNIVKAGIEHGEIRQTIEPQSIANTMISMLEGSLIMSRIEGTKKPLQDACTMLECMLDGIATKCA